MAPRFPRKPLLRSLAVCAAVLALCAGSQLTAGAAHNTWALWSNETLTPGQFLSIGISGQNSGYRLELQTDGNLVLYRWNGKALWWTGTWGQSISHLVMQSDGNLVLYRTNGTAAWSSGTFGSGHRIELWPDGNLVMKNSANAAVWSTGTWENQQGGNLMTWCGFQANRTATIRVRKVLDNGAIANTRARQLVDFGAWYWNAAGTLSPQFQVVEPQSSGSEIESVIDTGLGLVYARADGARTALCPLPTQPANLTLRINTSILNTDAATPPRWSTRVRPLPRAFALPRRFQCFASAVQLLGPCREPGAVSVHSADVAVGGSWGLLQQMGAGWSRPASSSPGL